MVVLSTVSCILWVHFLIRRFAENVWQSPIVTEQIVILNMIIPSTPVGVVPILIGPLQVLIAILPAIIAAVFGAIVTMLKPSSVKAGFKVLWRNKFATVAFVAVIVGLVYVFSFVSSLFGGKAGAAEAANSDWAMFRGNAERNGYSVDGYENPNSGDTQWVFDKDVKTFYASPAVMGNRVYISSSDKGPFKDKGTIYCLDADSGAVVWKYAPKGFRATFSSPSINQEGYLVCGEGLHFTKKAMITCLKVENDKPKKLWAYETKSHVESTACIYDGKTYLGAGDDGMYCFDLEPKKNGDANMRWHLEGEKYPDCEASAVALDGKIYFCLGMGGNAVVCADANTGDEIWRAPTPYPVFGCPTILDGKLFVGMGNGNFIENAETVRTKELQKMKDKGATEEELAEEAKKLGPAGEVWCFDLENNGEKLWSYKLKRTVLGTIAAADGKIYFGDRSGVLTCLDLNGVLVKQVSLHEPLTTSPVVTEKYLYYITESGKLYGMERETLESVWEVKVGTGGLYLSSPAVARGHVYVGTSMNGMICIGEPSSTEKIALWSGNLGGAGKSGITDASPLPARARSGWRYPGKKSTNVTVPEVKLPFVSSGDSLVAAIGGERKGVLCLELNENRSKDPAEKWFNDTASVSALALYSNYIYAVTGQAGDTDRSLTCISFEDGKTLWSKSVADGASGGMVVSLDEILIFAEAGKLSSLSHKDGAPENWSVAIENAVGSPLLAGDLVLVASSSPSQVKALSGVGGVALWEADVDASIVSGPVAYANRVAVGTDKGVAILDILTGEPVANYECGKLSVPLVCNDLYLASVTDAGVLVVADWTGKEVYREEGVVVGISPLLRNNQLVFFTTDNVKLLNISTGESSLWVTKIGWLGECTAAAVMEKSHLYFGTSKKGIVCLKPRK